MLEFLCVARLVTDDQASIWYQRYQEIRENGFRTWEHPRHDGRRSGDLRSADPLILVFRKKSWKACQRGGTRDEV